GYLFLSAPPVTALPVADFRTLPEAGRGKYSPELEDVLNDAFRKRDWLRERRIKEGQIPLPFIGRFSDRSSPEVICEDIRHILGLTLPTARDAKSWEEHLHILVHQAEAVGIIVLQSGYVGSNTHRTLSAEEFRGFTITDPHAPLIFLNAKDSVNGRIFTLAHELGHLWTGTSGISKPEPAAAQKGQPAIERLCNRAAAELLVPEKVLTARWHNRPATQETFQQLAREFRVSILVILIRVYETGLISERDFREAYSQVQQQIQEAATDETRSSAGGNFYFTFRSRNGGVLLREIAQALREGTLLHKEASWLLNTTPKTLDSALHEYQ
ncbi:MAG: ImmA/IrrE family metallo-endopeptidase, partial [Chloroflexi bacterium]|nr:ImmA/IrrE family metallo-endopeptidase [Chloroflexota bacterium]